MDIRAEYLRVCAGNFRSMKTLAERALEQVADDDLRWAPDAESNSITVIVKHLAGNMLSRWTDFLTSDGEKPDRHRDEEFVDTIETREELLAVWERGWGRLFASLEALGGDDLDRTIRIRGVEHSVVDAINRQLVHAAEHVGQIIYIAKHRRAGEWRSLSVPRGKSEEFNARLFSAGS